MEYKTFKDLHFEPWAMARNIMLPGYSDATQAVMEFPNGYSISVLHGECFYSDENTYEVAALRDGKIVYIEPIFPDDDVLGWQTAEQVTEIMRKVQEL